MRMFQEVLINAQNMDPSLNALCVIPVCDWGVDMLQGVVGVMVGLLSSMFCHQS